MAVLSEIAHLMENRVHISSYEELHQLWVDASFFKHLMPIWRGTMNNDDNACSFMHVYKFEKYYVVIESFVESCDGCYKQFGNCFDKIIEHNISKAYVVNTYDECMEYADMKRYDEDEE